MQSRDTGTLLFSVLQNTEVGHLQSFEMIELQTHTNGRLFTYKEMTFKNLVGYHPVSYATRAYTNRKGGVH